MRHQHYTNFSDIAQQNSQANFEQKDKIVWNTSKVKFNFTGKMNFAN